MSSRISVTRCFTRVACLAILGVCVTADTVHAATITLNATASGTYHSNGTFFVSGNYAVGWYPNAQPPGELRDFFIFDLTGVTGVITAATLRAQNPSFGYLSPDPNETWSIFDVSTNLTTLSSGTGGLGAFNDLGSGTGYGSVTVNNSSNSTNVDLVLNASGLAFLNSVLGMPAAFGGAITSINFANTTQAEALFNASSGTMTRQLILTTADSSAVPEPGSLLLFGTALVAAARARHRRPR